MGQLVKRRGDIPLFMVGRMNPKLNHKILSILSHAFFR
jgi:hypothetical protein